jgi:hypothetical protein
MDGSSVVEGFIAAWPLAGAQAAVAEKAVGFG